MIVYLNLKENSVLKDHAVGVIYLLQVTKVVIVLQIFETCAVRLTKWILTLCHYYSILGRLLLFFLSQLFLVFP